MGFAITWFAFRASESDALLRELNLIPTGETDDGPDSLIATAKLKNGWQVLWYNKYDCPFLEESVLKRLSARCEIIKCLVEEHVMASSSEYWSRGQRSWSLSHEGENGPKGLSVEGEPPPCFSEIRRKMEDTQAAEGGDAAEVDYIFEIPLLVAKALAGFKHDERCDLMVDPAFQVLSRIEAPRPGFISRLFGKK
jgi:hypothetical protein